MKKFPILVLAIVFIVACGNLAQKDEAQKSEAVEETAEQLIVYETALINVEGMHCTGCEKAITGALGELEGVKDARASFENGEAKVQYDPAKVKPEDFKTAIEGKGYKMSGYEIIPDAEEAVNPDE